MSYETEDKMVSHPDHYKSGKYEVIDIIDEFCKDLVGIECVCTANALKYIMRWKKKNGIQDVKKAMWYLQHMVDIYEYAERDEKIVAETIEESFPTLKEVLYNPAISYDTYHMEDRTSGSGMKISEQVKKSLASQGFKKIIIHHMDGHSSNEVIDISEFAPDTKKGIDDEPEPLNLRKNAAGVYIPEDTTKVTSAQVMYASKVITKYCNSMNSCDNCPFFDPDSNGVSCKFRLNSPNAWCICAKEENDIMNPPYDQLLSDFKEAKERIEALEDDRKIKAKSAKALEEENSNLKFDLSEIANIMLKFLAQTDMKLVGRSEKGFVDISHECKSLSDKIHDCLAKYEMED